MSTSKLDAEESQDSHFRPKKIKVFLCVDRLPPLDKLKRFYSMKVELVTTISSTGVINLQHGSLIKYYSIERSLLLLDL